MNLTDAVKGIQEDKLEKARVREMIMQTRPSFREGLAKILKSLAERLESNEQALVQQTLEESKLGTP